MALVRAIERRSIVPSPRLDLSLDDSFLFFFFFNSTATREEGKEIRGSDEREVVFFRPVK